MKPSVLALIVLSFFIMLNPALAADAPTPKDVVTLKDGSVIYGEVAEMARGCSKSRPLSVPNTDNLYLMTLGYAVDTSHKWS